MNTNPNTQLPDEVDIEIKVKADDVFNKIDLLAIPFRPKVLEIIEGALTEYATTVYQAQQEIESLTNQLKKQNQVQDENMKAMRAENEHMRKECERLSELVFQLSPRRRNSIDDL